MNTQQTFRAITQSELTDAVCVVGKIMRVVGSASTINGVTGYFSSNVAYDIATSIPGLGVVVFTGQVPQIRQWQRGEVLVDADALVDKAVTGVLVGNTVRWTFVEPPAMGSCSTPNPAIGTVRMPDGTIGTRRQSGGIDLPPIDGGTSDLPSNPTNAPGGGEE